MKAFLVEIRKNKLPQLLLLTFGFSALLLFWMCASYMNAKSEMLATGWDNMLADLPMLYVIFSPVYLTVLASQIADVEHKGDALKLLFVLQPRKQLYHGKLMLGFMLCLLQKATELLLMLLVGKLFHFEGPAPVGRFLLYFLCCFLVSAGGYLLQLNLSLRFKNQAIPLCIGIGCALAGLLMTFYSTELTRHLYYWTNYLTLSLSLMDYNAADKTYTFIKLAFNPWGLVSVGLWSSLAYACGRRRMQRKEL